MKRIALSAVAVFFSLSAQAQVPQQLNTEGFASCLAQQLPQVNYLSGVARNILFPGDLLLPYLAVYSGKRLPLVGAFSQYRWSNDYESEEEDLARALSVRATEQKSLLPNAIYYEALKSCGHENAFCAALISHNVLRTLGRSKTALWTNPITGGIYDYNPQWFKRDRQNWLLRAKQIQRAMISLHRDGSDDKWGDNYHFFGLLTFSIHEKSLYNSINAAWLVARLNKVLNPILAGGAEDSAKARIDRDTIDVATRYFDQSFRSGVWNCGSALAYRARP
jgi:hypothetical protein